MHSLCYRMVIISLAAFCILFLIVCHSHALTVPPDSLNFADRFALLTPISNRAIVRVQAKVEAPGPESPYSHETLEALPALLSEYRPEELFLSSSGSPSRNESMSQQGTLILGPITVRRESEFPKTKQIPFSISDATGPFFLRLTNGTPEGIHRVSGASVVLNGREVFKPCEINQKVANLNRQVTLRIGENLLEVRLRSAFGSFITLELFRLDEQSCRVFAPQTFVRSKGKPKNETVSFGKNLQFHGPFSLSLTNGDSAGFHKVDSAIIKLNGYLVFGPNSLNEHVQYLWQTVSLQPTNVLSVELRGKPGDLLTIEITGYDDTPPTVTITGPANGAVLNTTPISVNGTVDDPHASVIINGNVASVASDGSFTVEGIILQEGENPIKAIAVDSCGNQGEDQVLVYLRTVPQGPQLIVCAELFLEHVPKPPGADCSPQAFGIDLGTIAGLTDETAVSIMLNGTLMPDGVMINDQGDISMGKRDGNFFWAFVWLPQIDGIHPFTAVATNAEGGQTQVTVTVFRDTVPPQVATTSPHGGLVTNIPIITVTGTVDDPQAEVRLGWYGPAIPVVNGTFTTQVTLPLEGTNIITIYAEDPAGNYSSLQLRVTLDTQPPQINVTTPVENAAVNASTLQVMGNIIDQNIETLNVVVNNGQPQTLPITGSSFGGAVTLTVGPNTLTFGAKDKAGNTSSVTRAVLLDLGPPSVSITAPASGAIVSGMIDVTVEASDTMSGVDGVAFYVDNQLQATLTQPPFSFTLNTSGLTPGSHTLTAKTADKAGNQAEVSITISVPESLKIEITSPTNGATINQLRTIVQGRIYNYVGEVGVTLNGYLAEVQGSDFAVIVPLQVGQNILTAAAAGADGFQAQTSVTVNTESQEEPIRLTATPASGILDPTTNTLSVTFEAETYLENSVSSYSWDFNGDGVAEITGIDSSVTWEYPLPGLYFPRVIVTDNQGNAYTETTLVNVLSGEEIDALLRSRWEAMKEALEQNDIDNAIGYFDDFSKSGYKEHFTALSPMLSQIVQELNDIQFIGMMKTAVEYDIRTIRDGIEYSFYLLFIRDKDGLWKIRSF